MLHDIPALSYGSLQFFHSGAGGPQFILKVADRSLELVNLILSAAAVVTVINGHVVTSRPGLDPI